MNRWNNMWTMHFGQTFTKHVIVALAQWCLLDTLTQTSIHAASISNTSAATTNSTSVTSSSSIRNTANTISSITCIPTGTFTTIPSGTITSIPTGIITTVPTDTITTVPTGIITTVPTGTITTVPTGTITTVSTGTITTVPTTAIIISSTKIITTKPTTAVASNPATTNNVNPTHTNTSIVTSHNPLKLSSITTTMNYYSVTTGRSTEKYIIPLERMQIEIPFQLKINETLGNSATNCNTTFQRKLNSVFNTTDGFQYVTITGCSNGSLVVNFTVYFKNAEPGQLREDLMHVYQTLLLNPEFNTTFLKDYFTQDFDRVFSEICTDQQSRCSSGYKCVLNVNQQPVCQHKCFLNESKNMCYNAGDCVLDRDSNPMCLCHDDNDFHYSGKKCEDKADKLELSKTYIIAIAAGTGGGIILILLVIIIIIICRRNNLKKRLQKDNVLDNGSEQSYKSLKDSDDGIRQPVNQQSNTGTPGYDIPIFRLSEERAENPRYNPYLSLQSAHLPVTSQLDFSQGYPPAENRTNKRQRENARESTRHAQPESWQFQDGVPNYGDPARLQQFQHVPSKNDYLEIEKKQSKPFDYQPKKVMRPLAEFKHKISHNPPPQPLAKPKVYDYSHRNEPEASGFSFPSNDTQLYDFDLENNIKQEPGINDPYSIKRPLVTSRQF